MAMRGSPRPQETHLTVVGYDDAGDAGRKGGDGPSARAHGGLTGADDGEKGGKRRGIASIVRNFVLVRLRYDPTVALILLLVVVAVGLVAAGLAVLPVIFNVDVGDKHEASERVAGFDGVVGLIPFPKPEELTGGTLKRAANGDFRFMLNDKNYAISPYGGVYVGAEDLERPFIMPDGSYNPRNVRHFRFEPARFTILPEAVTQEELEALVREGDGALQRGGNLTATDGVEHSLAVLPTASEVRDRILKRIEPYSGLPPSFAQQWTYRKAEFDDAHDEDGKEAELPEGVQRGRSEDDPNMLWKLLGLSGFGPEKLRHDFINHDVRSGDINRVVSGSLFLANESPHLKRADGLVGGSRLFAWDENLALADATLLKHVNVLPSLLSLQELKGRQVEHEQDRAPYQDPSMTAAIMDEIKEQDGMGDAQIFWQTMEKYCSMDRKRQISDFGKKYRQNLLDQAGPFLIKPQARTIILFDNVWTKFMFKEREKQMPIRHAFNGLCAEEGVIKQLDIAYQDAEKFATLYKKLIAAGRMSVSPGWL